VGRSLCDHHPNGQIHGEGIYGNSAISPEKDEVMDWHTWLWDLLRGDPEHTNLVSAEQIHHRGTLQETPTERPFEVLRFENETPELEEASFQDVTIWVHDNPGSYMNIDAILRQIRMTLEGPVTSQEGIMAIWQGDSPDLFDDERGTIVRNTSYRLVGRR
jgi:hypothetical protein